MYILVCYINKYHTYYYDRDTKQLKYLLHKKQMTYIKNNYNLLLK